MPGLEHTLHNMQHESTKTIVSFYEWLIDAREMSTMLQCRMYIQLIVNSCLVCAESRWLREKLGQGKIPGFHEQRFGPLMNFLDALMPLRALQRFFKPELLDKSEAESAQKRNFH